MDPPRFNSLQLVALWYGGVVASLILGAYARAEESVFAGVVAILLVTTLIVVLLGDHPKADAKRVYWWSFGLPAGLVVLAGAVFGLIRFLGGEAQSAGSDTTTSEGDVSAAVRSVLLADWLDSVPQIGASEIDYPAELSSLSVYGSSSSGRGRGSCVEVGGTITNNGSEVIEAVGIRVSIRDTLGNVLADPASGQTAVTVAPKEEQYFSRLRADVPCMEGPNRQYHVALTDVELRR